MTTSELPLIVEEAINDISAISNLQITFSDPDLRARIPSVARQASSDAAILFLSATFEEANRQMAREFMRSAFAAGKLAQEEILKVRKMAWIAATEKMKFNKYGGDGFDNAAAALTIDAMKNFCIDGNFINDYSDLLIFNRRNLTPNEIDSLYMAAGLSHFCKKVSRNNTFKNYFSVNTLDDAEQEFKRKINSFIKSRNLAMHDLSAHRAAGSVDIYNISQLLMKTLERAEVVLQEHLL